MNRKIHLILVLGCVLIAVLDAPRASRLFSEGLAGPYEESARVRSAPVDPRTQSLVPARNAAAPVAPKAEPAKPVPASVLLNSSVRPDPNVDPDEEAAR
ncbi:MAG: hypothetical protein HZA52_21225 [Planctomycetes bacterium]|nr:hypothetical protein [Planctomycetota bacterium]